MKRPIPKPFLPFVAAFVALIGAWAGGCGGGGGIGGGPPSPSSLTAKGMVTLPARFAIPISELSVSTENGAFPINANGSFAATVSSNGPRIIQLVHTKTNKIVLLGYADAASSGSPFANGQGRISATSTADALLFVGLEGAVFPASRWANFLAVIHSSSQEAQVASVVSTRLVANPTAISDGDTAIESAVGAVQSSYVAPSIASLHQIANWKPSVQRVTVSRTGSSTGALINVSPGSPQSSLVVAPNPKGDGIVAVSNSRRRGAIFIYKVAAGPTANNTTPIIPPQEVAADVDVEPEEEIGTFFTSILKGLQGNFAYIPVTSPPILLKADPVQEVAVYDVVAIGPGSTDTFAQIENSVTPTSDSERLAMDRAWRAANTKTYLKVVVKDIVIPTMIELIMGSGEAESVAADPGTEAAIEHAAESLPDVAAALASHDIKSAVTRFLDDIKNDVSGIKGQVISALARSLVSSGRISAATFQNGLTRLTQAAAIIEIINKGLAVADITQAIHDNTVYNTADLWTADVLVPKVTLFPNPATVNDIQNIAILSAQIQGESDLSKFRFQWSTSGTEGSLEEPHSSIPMPTGLTSFAECAYVADLHRIKNGNSDTVTVRIFSVNDITTLLATATGIVKTQPGLENGTFFIDSKDVFLGIVKNDPWVLSAVVTCPYVPGATSYIVEASGPATGTYAFFVSTSGGALQVLDGSKKPYRQYVATSSGVTICLFGLDALNAAVPGATAFLKAQYPINTVNVTYK